MVTTGFNSIADAVRKKPKMHMAIANGIDRHTIEAVSKAVELEYITATLVGDAQTIKSECKRLGFNGDKFSVVDISDPAEAVNVAVAMVHDGGKRPC
jgi:phosphotransacetylase